MLTKVKVAVTIEPPILKFSNLKQESLSFTLKNKLEKDLTINSIGIEKDIITYQILNAAQNMPLIMKPNQNLDIMVKPKAKNEATIYAYLTIYTDYEDHPILKVPINIPPQI